MSQSAILEAASITLRLFRTDFLNRFLYPLLHFRKLTSVKCEALNSRLLGWLFVLTVIQQSDKHIVVVFFPTDLSELDNPSQKEQIIRLEGPHPFKVGSPTAMSLLTNICSICSQSSPVLEIPHLPQTANFPASFPSATESFIHYLTWISSFATTGIPSTTNKEKKMLYSLQQPLNHYHLKNLSSYLGMSCP